MAHRLRRWTNIKMINMKSCRRLIFVIVYAGATGPDSGRLTQQTQNICKNQRGRLADVVQTLYICFVFAELVVAFEYCRMGLH